MFVIQWCLKIYLTYYFTEVVTPPKTDEGCSIKPSRRLGPSMDFCRELYYETSGSVASHRLSALDNLPRVPNPEEVLSNERPIKLYFSKIL